MSVEVLHGVLDHLSNHHLLVLDSELVVLMVLMLDSEQELLMVPVLALVLQALNRPHQALHSEVALDMMHHSLLVVVVLLLELVSVVPQAMNHTQLVQDSLVMLPFSLVHKLSIHQQ